LLLSLSINGCGGSKSPSATVPTATTATTAHAAPAPATTVPPTTSGPAATSAQRTATAPPQTQTAGASNVRIPATFVITARGSVSPSMISAPAGVSIQLTVASGDAHAHQVVLRARPARALAVPAGGRASARLSGLGKGRYELEVDGAAAGTLFVGAQPGP
jgi:hypothetical protein